MLHDGVTRRSDDEFADVMRMGTSAADWRDIVRRVMRIDWDRETLPYREIRGDIICAANYTVGEVCSS
jgi:hypothetical protein